MLRLVAGLMLKLGLRQLEFNSIYCSINPVEASNVSRKSDLLKFIRTLNK